MNENELVKWIEQLIKDKKLWKFYKSIPWMDLKKEVLKEQNFECQECKKLGKITKADTVHHVQFVTKHPQLALSRHYTYKGKQYRNLVAVCKSCHNKLHPEKGYGISRKLYIITGLPGAGKTTYVKNKMKSNDLVYDLDYIAKSFTYGYKTSNSIKITNKILSTFIEEAMKLNGNVYIIRTSPSSDELELFNRYNCEFIEIQEDVSVCYERRKDYISKEEFERIVFKHNIYLNTKKNNSNDINKERW